MKCVINYKIDFTEAKFIEVFKKSPYKHNFSEEGLKLVYGYLEANPPYEVDLELLCWDLMEYKNLIELIRDYPEAGGCKTLSDLDELANFTMVDYSQKTGIILMETFDW